MKAVVSIMCATIALAACSAPAPVEEVAAAPADELPLLEVTARELSAAFDANEVAAMQKYGGSQLVLAGEIVAVELDLDDTPVVLLKTDEFFNVRLHFMGKNGAATASLKKGETAVFQCVGLREALGMPILDNCALDAPTASAAT